MPAELRTPHVVGISMIAGRGLFAASPVSAGDTVVSFPTAPVDEAQLGTVNHSCDPTIAWGSAVSLVALRDIPEGTELVLDYSTVITEPRWVLFCHCGTYRCRQAVEGTDWRIPQLRRRYAGQWHPRVEASIAAD